MWERSNTCSMPKAFESGLGDVIAHIWFAFCWHMEDLDLVEPRGQRLGH